MIHADVRRDAARALARQRSCAARASPSTPASEDASFRRYFRAALDDGRSFIAMDAPPDKEDCRPFVHVAGLLREAGVHAPQVLAQDLAQGFLLLTDLGTRTYLRGAERAATPPRLFADATDALVRWQLASAPASCRPTTRRCCGAR